MVCLLFRNQHEMNERVWHKVGLGIGGDCNGTSSCDIHNHIHRLLTAMARTDATLDLSQKAAMSDNKKL